MGLGDKLNLELSFHGAEQDNSPPVYFSGDIISGTVTVEHSGEIKVKYLAVYARGKAKVNWEESKKKRECKEDILNVKYILLGQENAGADREIQLGPGKHEYEFRFQLPQSPLVPSFEGKYGHIRYYIKAELHRSWHLTATAKSYYVIFQHIDTNAPSMLIPQSHTDKKTICCFCCASGPIVLTVRMEKMGYIAGELLPITAEIQNNSSRSVIPGVTIYQAQTFISRSETTTVLKVLIKLKGKQVPGKTSETWNCQTYVPQYPPPVLNCNILRMEYLLKVKLKIFGASSLTLYMPLVIGSIPARLAYSSDVLM